MEFEAQKQHKSKTILLDLLRLLESHSLAVRDISLRVDSELLRDRIRTLFLDAKDSINSLELSFLKYEDEERIIPIGRYKEKKIFISRVINPEALLKVFFNQRILEFRALLELIELHQVEIVNINERLSTSKIRLQKKLDHIEKVGPLEIKDLESKLDVLNQQKSKLILELEEEARRSKPLDPKETAEYENIQKMISDLREFRLEEITVRENAYLKKLWVLKRGALFALLLTFAFLAMFYGKRKIQEESEKIKRMNIDNEIAILLSSPIVTNGINDKTTINKVKKAESYLDAVNLINKSILQNTHFTSSLYKAVELRGIVFNLDKASNKVFLGYNKSMPKKIQNLVGDEFSVGAYTITGTNDSEITFYSSSIDENIQEGFKIDYLCRAGPLGFLVRVPIRNFKMLEFRFDPRDQTTNLNSWLKNQGFCKDSK